MAKSHYITSNDIRGSNTITHNHNCLMGTIAFEVHHITLISPRNTLLTILKAFWFLLFFMFFAYFSFKHIMHGYIREKENTQLCKLEHPYFDMQVLHLTKHSFYELHTNVLWLMSFSSEIRDGKTGQTRLTWPVWPATRLTRNLIDPFKNDPFWLATQLTRTDLPILPYLPTLSRLRLRCKFYKIFTYSSLLNMLCTPL